MRTRFVLVETSHAGNVGAVARALKVMGFDDWVLVRPRWPDALQRPEAVERASGAADWLARARVAATLDEALEGISHVCATAMTPRDFGPPVAAPREYLAALAPRMRSGGEQGVAFVFGPERYGLANADVHRSHVCLRIPTAADYGSLNLAAAVQLIAYEWRLALGGFGPEAAGAARGPAREPPADAPAVSGLLEHWREALLAVGYLDPASPKKLMARLRLLVQRAAPTASEVHILRGVARAILAMARRASR
ncbi:tRNA (cytidine/uridine-2'-O-)-methyltransferase TrmJ [Tepidimonas alkaliphilus]|uniref:tRNA (Cytidine/uridine-2'-O-)-methyltransferase TrmJ n=1 Tax=Tepidimonas alkaliphilus TaxID=2588942 RepID=A0A554W656_9BURK|nr:RNA methyltransferase [Tepidimonas alkaliphilus]TSE19053.1 tRNA (cytidine/uridine-2'-O-)-methyltransferase TrmJ [Tepidimonas alkaliphilus]